MHMHESPKQMHTPLIPQLNLLLAPHPPATELLKAAGFCYLWGWGNACWYNKQILKRAHTVTCTYMRMDLVGCLSRVGCDLSESYSRYAVELQSALQSQILWLTNFLYLPRICIIYPSKGSKGGPVKYYSSFPSHMTDIPFVSGSTLNQWQLW